MHLSIDHPYLALVHLNWLRKHLPYKLQALYEVNELEGYLNRVTQRAQKRINDLMNEGGIVLADAQKQVILESLTKTRDYLTQQELAEYHALDLLKLTPAQKMAYKDVYRKIEYWYRAFRQALPQKYRAYYRDIGEYQEMTFRKKWGWGKSNGHLLQVLGIEYGEPMLYQETSCSLLVTLQTEYENASRPPLFAIRGIEVKPIDFFEDQMKLEYCHSFGGWILGKIYRFSRGDTFIVDQRDLTAYPREPELLPH